MKHYSQSDFEMCRASTPQGAVPIDSGVVNPAFFVGNDKFRKFNTRDPYVRKLEREKRLLEILQKHDLPVPEVIGYGLEPFEWLETSRLPGNSIELQGVSEQLCQQAGEILQKLHKIDMQFFGDFAQGGIGQTNSWSEYIRQYIDYWGSKWDWPIRDQVEAAIQQNLPLLHSVARPKPVHGDFQFNNLLTDGKIITGLIDFEWCFAGDPAFDLLKAPTWDDQYSGASEKILTAYGGTPYDWDKKSKLYRAIHHAEIGYVAQRFWTEKSARELEAQSVAALKVLHES